jgi:diamine N-acetyltransferase
MDKVILRIAAEEDLDWLLEVENDASHWAVGGRTHRYTRDELADFLGQNHSFLPDGNLRWIICTEEEEEALGVLDIFAYDKENEMASLGILITESAHRRQGFGLKALELVENEAFGEWGLKGLQALVQADNMASQGLFTKAGYTFKYKQDKGLLLFQKDRP